jgi:hypothetical protein
MSDVLTRPAEPEVQIVQAVHGQASDLPQHRGESLGLFAFFLVAYTALGYWLVVDLHVVGFDTLDRLDRALMMWHNDPPKLSAIGFDLPPLSTILVSPLAVVPALARSLVVVPLTSAVFAAWLMVSLNTVGRRTGLSLPVRYAVLLLAGANPLFVLYACDGSSDVMGLALIACAAGMLIGWFLTTDIRFVMLGSLVLAVAVLTSYVSLEWVILAAILVVGTLATHRAGEEEMEGTLVGLLAPAVFVTLLWIIFNTLLAHRPLGWVERYDVAVPGPAALVRQSLDLIGAGAPVAVPVLVALLMAGVVRRDRFALWWAAALVVSMVTPAVSTALRLTNQPMALRSALPILVCAVLGGLWLARSFAERSAGVGAVLALALACSIPWTLHEMRVFPRQGLEAAFARAVTSGNSQEGTTSTGGAQIGIDDELDAAAWVRAHVHGDGQVLTDNARTYGVILLTGEPAVFYDRVDRSDGPWLQAAAHPRGQVAYLLISSGGDALTAQLPQVASGHDPDFPVVYRNDRYLILRVPRATAAGGSAAAIPDTAPSGASTTSMGGNP